MFREMFTIRQDNIARIFRYPRDQGTDESLVTCLTVMVDYTLYYSWRMGTIGPGEACDYQG